MTNQELAYDVVLLDHDGVQGDTLNTWADGYEEVFNTPWPDKPNEPRIKASREAIIGSMGFFRRDIKEIWGQTEEVADLLVAETHALLKPKLETIRLHSGLPETLQTLARLGVKQAVLAKSHRQVVEKAMRYHGIHGYIGAFVGGNELFEDEQKPHPLSVRLGLERLGIDRKTTDGVLVIGDSIADLEMARSAGVASVLYRPEENAPFYNYDEMRAACKPDFEITHLTQLIDIVKYGELQKAS